MSIVSLVLKSLEGGEKLLQRDALKADAIVDANRQKQVDLLLEHRNKIREFENKIAAENDHYANVSDAVQRKTAAAVKRGYVARKFADSINQLISGETA